MSDRRPAVARTVHRLIETGFDGHAADGDSFAIWLLSDRPTTNAWPAQTWSRSEASLFAAAARNWILRLPFNERLRSRSIRDTVLRGIGPSRPAALFLLTEGGTGVGGTGIDAAINGAFALSRRDVEVNRGHFTVALLYRDSDLPNWIVSANDSPVHLPAIARLSHTFSMSIPSRETLIAAEPPEIPQSSPPEAAFEPEPAAPGIAEAPAPAEGTEPGPVQPEAMAEAPEPEAAALPEPAAVAAPTMDKIASDGVAVVSGAAAVDPAAPPVNPAQPAEATVQVPLSHDLAPSDAPEASVSAQPAVNPPGPSLAVTPPVPDLNRPPSRLAVVLGLAACLAAVTGLWIVLRRPAHRPSIISKSFERRRTPADRG